MKRYLSVLSMFLVFCLFGHEQAAAQSATVADKEQLTKDMYRLYATNKTDSFALIVERLKEVALGQGDERTFYKAWSNLVIYTKMRFSRQKSLEEAVKLRSYAQQHNSKYGIYAAAYANGSLFSSLKNYEGAVHEYELCINYLENYFPNEEKAPVYLALAKVYYNLKRFEDIRQCAEKALNDPYLTQVHRLTAWSYMCMSYNRTDSASIANFERCYSERCKVRDQLGHRGVFGDIVDYIHAKLNKDYDLALELAEKLEPIERFKNRCVIYELKGDYHAALTDYKKFVALRDSMNSDEMKRMVSDNALLLDVARKENEAKDLWLANQALMLQQVENELEQQHLEAENDRLLLKQQQTELENAAMQLENATLDSKAKELELREQTTQLEMQMQAERSRRHSLYLIMIASAVVLALLTFFLWRRQKQMKKLKAVNEELQTTYSNLEQTRSDKERIESELHIARDIQMTMVPHVFPDCTNLELHAYMQPAKQVGGDLYTFLLVDSPNDRDDTDAHLYFCIGDVSGKGVPAALFMAQTTRLFRSLAAQGLMPADIANKMNAELSDNNEHGMFVTMFIGLANMDTGRMDFCNCGHNPPVIDGDFLQMESNTPIALWPEMNFVGEHIEDIRGKRFFLYTDGLNEAENNMQQQFGDEQLLALIRSHPKYNSQQTIDMFVKAVAKHVGDAEPSDDLTMLCLIIDK